MMRKSGIKRKIAIRSFDKLAGARVLRNAFAATAGLRRSKRPLVRVLLPFRAVRAPTLKLLETKIMQVSKGKKCERVFIRGNPIKKSVGRMADWGSAPRGDLDMKTGKIVWDNPPGLLATIEKHYCLLYATRPKTQIEKEGRVSIVVNAKGAKGQFKFGGKPIYFNIVFREGKPVFVGEKIETLGGLGREFSDFITAVFQQGGWNSAQLRFVKWKDKKGIEFFDFIKLG